MFTVKIEERFFGKKRYLPIAYLRYLGCYKLVFPFQHLMVQSAYRAEDDFVVRKVFWGKVKFAVASYTSNFHCGIAS
jgi:hypothetical protein